MGREREALYLLPGLGNTQEVKWGAAKSVLFVWHGPELRLGHYKSPEQQRQDETCVKPQNQSVSGGWPAFTSWTHTHTHTPICTSTHVNTPSCEHTHTTTHGSWMTLGQCSLKALVFFPFALSFPHMLSSRPAQTHSAHGEQCL